jgi:hypothetical protein
MKYFLPFILVLLFACDPVPKSIVKVYSAPGEEPKSADFVMEVNDQPVFVYQARVSKYPINQIWPGYQRPINQTEIASFAYFDFQGVVTVRITSSKEIKTLDIRPKEFGIKPVIKGNTIEFKLLKPLQFVVEVNGYHQALHVFANPAETVQVDKTDPKVHYFGPGVHEAGMIDVKSGESVYIDGGAVVFGYISSENARDIKIGGRGILDASKIERGKAPAMISLKKVTNASVNGIILRDSHFWAIIPVNCDSVAFNNLKLIGHWRYNSDGLDIVSCKNIQFKNSFIRTFDDNIVIRGTKRAYVEPYKIIENITVDSCVLWNDWGRAIEIGASIVVDTIRNVRFTNCQIPHFTAVAMDIQNCDRGYIKDIHFENIAIEGLISDSLMIATDPIVPRAWGKIAVLGIYSTFYSEDTVRGNIDHIYFNNIRYNRSDTKQVAMIDIDSVRIDKNISFKDYDKFIRDNIYFGDIGYNTKNDATFYLSGYDDTHKIENVYIKDYFIDGKKVTDLGTVGKNKFVQGIFIE